MTELIEIPLDDIDDPAKEEKSQHDNAVKNSTHHGQIILETLFYFSLTIPVTLLTVIMVLASGNPKIFESIQSPYDFWVLLKDSTITNKILAILFAYGTTRAQLILRQTYFKKSVEKLLALIKNDWNAIQAFCLPFLPRFDTPKFDSLLLENVCAALSFMTALIFGSLGAKGMRFLGEIAEILGFSISLMNVFILRYAGTAALRTILFDDDYKLKHYFSSILLRLPEQAYPEPETILDDNIISALTRYLTHAETAFDTLPPIRTHNILYHSVNTTSDLMGVVSTVMLNFALIPSAVDGFNLLTGSHIGVEADYHDGWSFLTSTPLNLLTLIFYIRANMSLLFEFLRTGLLIEENIRHAEWLNVFRLLAKTLLNGLESYMAAYAFQAVINLNKQEGDFSYLGILSEILPVFAGIINTFMLWDHAQFNLNNVEYFSDETESLQKINHKEAAFLLRQQDTDISQFKDGFVFTLWGASRRKENDLPEREQSLSPCIN